MLDSDFDAIIENVIRYVYAFVQLCICTVHMFLYNCTVHASFYNHTVHMFLYNCTVHASFCNHTVHMFLYNRIVHASFYYYTVHTYVILCIVRPYFRYHLFASVHNRVEVSLATTPRLPNSPSGLMNTANLSHDESGEGGIHFPLMTFWPLDLGSN